MKRKTLALLALVVAATITVGAFYTRRGDDAPAFMTDVVSRGDIVNVVSSTGTLQAVTTVEVGSQVSGTIESLHADFNSIVKKGQLLAKLDQSTFVTAVEQAKASLVNAEAEVERLRVGQGAAESALSRARDLASRQLIAAADLQTAETAAASARAQVVGAEAKVVQARSAVKTAQVNLDKTIIRSPIDGVVIARNVDVGQTVAASLSAPTLFLIAADLSDMQVNASIDESDVGQIHDGQPVTFRVDAYPNDTFEGAVSQVRLNPTTANNVVTYAAIINARNDALKLKPGMTANVTIEVARRDDVLRVPTAALRFKPDAKTLASAGVAAPSTTSTSSKSPMVWVSENGRLTAVPVRIGAADATHTELVNPPIGEGALVVTRMASTAAAPSTPSSSNGNPLMPSRPGPRR
jgi:HlyD family secretion protein